MQIVQFAEEHPIGVGIAVFVAGIVLIYLFFGGSKAPEPQQAASFDPNAAALASGNALQAAQLGAQAQTNLANIAAVSHARDVDAAIQMAGVTAGAANDAHQMDTAIASQMIALQSHQTDITADTILSKELLDTFGSALSTATIPYGSIINDNRYNATGPNGLPYPGAVGPPGSEGTSPGAIFSGIINGKVFQLGSIGGISYTSPRFGVIDISKAAGQ